MGDQVGFGRLRPSWSVGGLDQVGRGLVSVHILDHGLCDGWGRAGAAVMGRWWTGIPDGRGVAGDPR